MSLQRPRSALLVRFAACSIVGWAGVVAAAGCNDLRIADVPGEGGVASDDGGGVPDDANVGDGGTVSDATADAPPASRYYDDVQAKLQAKRFPGPTTPPGSKGYCTPKYFVWRESDDSLHSWAGKTQTKIDYAFKAFGTRPYFVPSDTLIAVDKTSYTGIDVYRTDAANTPVATSLPYAFNFVSAANGVIRLDQNVNGTPIDGTKVRLWDSSAMSTGDLIANVVPTKEPPSSFVNDVIVIPGGTAIPFPLYLVDVVKKTTSSVTFDGAIALQQTEQFAAGLAVAYVRNGTGGVALRIYKGDLDDVASRFELGDELANIGPYLLDTPNPSLEHKFLAHVTTWKQHVIYASAYGIWSYDMTTGALAPVQLASGKKTVVPDVMCVLAAENMLVYRNTNDALGQVWAVPLGSFFQ